MSRVAAVTRLSRLICRRVVSIQLSTFSMNGTSKLMYMHSRKRHRSFLSVFQDTGGLTECRDADSAASPGNPWCAFRCSGDLTLSSQAPLLMKSLEQSCTLVTRRRWDTIPCNYKRNQARFIAMTTPHQSSMQLQTMLIPFFNQMMYTYLFAGGGIRRVLLWARRLRRLFLYLSGYTLPCCAGHLWGYASDARRCLRDGSHCKLSGASS